MTDDPDNNQPEQPPPDPPPSDDGLDKNDPLNLAPHSVEAEEAVLGSILMNPEALWEVRTFLTGDDFFILRHSWIYEALIRLVDRNDPIDTRTLAEDLRAHEQLDDIGGEAYLNYLPTTMPTALHAEPYGHIVERAAQRRRLLGAAGEIAQLAHDEKKDINEVLAASESTLYTVTDQQTNVHRVPILTSLRSYYDVLEQRQASDKKFVGLPTGFYDLDAILAGLEAGDLLTLGARPGMGKTSFLVSLAHFLAKAGVSILWFTLEMGNEQLLQRLASVETEIAHHKFKQGILDAGEYARWVNAVAKIEHWPIIFDDSPSLNPIELRSMCRRVKREAGCDFVIVDYLQLMNGGPQRFENKTAEVSYITRTLKEIAREVGCPLLIAAQLNREVEKRQDKRPILSDLRDSGSIEQDSDVVMFLYRDEVYNEATEHPGEADVIIAKHRNGPTGSATLLFRKELMLFRNIRRVKVDLNTIGYD